MATFVLATANAHKAEEMRHVLEPLGIELLSIVPATSPDVDETEATLEGNALLKARALTAATGLAAIADDTGLFIDALEGRPGVYSARYAGENASFADNVRQGSPRTRRRSRRSQRGARFRSVIAVTYPDGTSWWVDGVLDGAFSCRPSASGGFGYDADLRADGSSDRSLAQLERR